jgi:hypothetical protein
MTHEYVIATGGRILGTDPSAGTTPTAIAWAADHVLAVGSDEAVRAISRGDSTFIDLDGCAVTALDTSATLEPGSPADLEFRQPGSSEVVALVRAGAFTAGDEHRGPFAESR